MGFSQTTFLFIYMPVCILMYLFAYKVSGKNLRLSNAVLICEGLVFFWWAEPRLLLFFVSLTLLMHFLGVSIYKAESDDEKNILMIFGVVIFAFFPIIYKYLPAIKMMTEDMQPVTMPLFAAILVPIGIVFFILGAISYILDIYMDKATPGSILDSFVFTMLFPKAVCGPIVLWREFSPQLNDRNINFDSVFNGIKRIIIGYAKKAIIADTFAAQIELINLKMSTNSTDSVTVWLLVLLYSFRIYYDFSGYSDIAIGLSEVLGFDIGENFKWPYLSGSVTEFWRRWHMSLGKWLREYIYIPLGGNREGNIYINIFITFIIAALWHGWKGNLLLWGALNGLVVITEKYIERKNFSVKASCFSGIIATFILVNVGWILFMSSDLTAALNAFKSLVVSPGGDIPNFTWQFFLTKRIAVFLIIAAAGAFGVLHRSNDLLKKKIGTTKYALAEKTFLIMLFAADILFVMGNSYMPFIYSIIP